MEQITIITENSLTCIRSIGCIIFYQEDWMKQKKDNAKANDAKKLKCNVK